MKPKFMQLLKKLALSLICLGVFGISKAQIDYKVGNGTAINYYYEYPAPIGFYFESDRHQLLFRASELQAAGMQAGAVLAIKWDVKDMGSSSTRPLTSVPDYEITIGSTTTNTLGPWISGITHIVRASANYTPTLGINTFVLATPFIWNGTDNIIIQTCQGVGAGLNIYTSNASFEYDSYGFNASMMYYSDGSGRLCNTSNYSTSPRRPNTIFSMGLPCNDTPKTTVRGPDKICPGKPFTLGPSDYYADATYSWEYSTNGISWANFTGVPNGAGQIKDSITSPKWYRVTVKCNANQNLKYTSPPHKVNIAPFYYCYCDNEVTSDAGADIGNLTVINTNKFDSVYRKGQLVTGSATPVYSNSNANRKYTPYHDSLGWPCLYRDTTYLYNVTQIHSGSSFETGVVQAYIDYNRDGLYNPNTERIFVQAMDGLNTNPHIVQVTAKVPSTAEIGPTGLRVIISKDTVKGAPCDTISGGGEVEDYIVEICHRPCNGPVATGVVVSTDTSMCAGYEYTLTDTTYEKQRSGFNRAWQVSGDNSTWFNIANSQNKDTLERIFAGQPLYYRLRTICQPTHDTNYSAGTLINTKPGYKCYCYSKAIGGLSYDSSDIGGVTIADYSSNAGGPHLLNALAVKPRTDFTDITPINLFTDSLYTFSVYHTMPVVEHGDAKVTVFMDFNNNHKYDIPEDRIYTGYTTIGNHTLVDNVIIPQTAITDVPTGMRVIVNNDVGPNVPSDSACGPYTSGETEDYVIIFRKPWPAGINGQAMLTGFNVHPNPTNGKCSIQFSTQADIKDIHVKVTNVTGQTVHQQAYTYEGGMFYKEMDMTGQPAGVYFVELQTEGQKLIRKLVVQ